MYKALWKNAILAESEHIEEVEGNIYFPPDSIQKKYFHASEHTTECYWKGTAHYYHLKVHEDINKNAAWYYPITKEKAMNIKGYVAFWKGVKIENA